MINFAPVYLSLVYCFIIRLQCLSFMSFAPLKRTQNHLAYGALYL